MKNQAKAIVERLEEGEEVMMTVVHLSEVTNIVEDGLGLEKSLGFLAWIIAKENIKVQPVTLEDYETALAVAKDHDISANDALAYSIMKRHSLTQAYSFDKHFNQLADIERLPFS